MLNENHGLHAAATAKMKLFNIESYFYFICFNSRLLENYKKAYVLFDRSSEVSCISD